MPGPAAIRQYHYHFLSLLLSRHCSQYGQYIGVMAYVSLLSTPSISTTTSDNHVRHFSSLSSTSLFSSFHPSIAALVRRVARLATALSFLSRCPLATSFHNILRVCSGSCLVRGCYQQLMASNTIFHHFKFAGSLHRTSIGDNTRSGLCSLSAGQVVRHTAGIKLIALMVNNGRWLRA